ncbi:Peptidase M14, carboxypeptidase A [Nosema bombycis CQ1]|uniref:Peptidase M14, carboxypeptidase A n=1 Tax=Nosema bombycis (strain CQ1 / CVCC 102059) TaxID=578461 RepID=R0MKU4_NOSB1|nr:Peptidase M14, carboxypeptidase A [Nosema bombycis CQ1]|eukprot:EOB13383.1 Peptidase M14, carboxypeptidase A [Nosema bombycis CQ1]
MHPFLIHAITHATLFCLCKFVFCLCEFLVPSSLPTLPPYTLKYSSHFLFCLVNGTKLNSNGLSHLKNPILSNCIHSPSLILLIPFSA